MRRIINAKLQIIKVALIFVLSIFIIYHSSFIIQAKDATPASSLTPIQKKVEDLKAEIASKAAQIKTEISQKISNKAYAGVVISWQDQTHATASAKLITIKTIKGDRTISVNDYTAFIDNTTSKKNLSQLKSIAQGDYISALGDVDDNQVLTAKKVIKSKPPQTSEIEVVWGQIQSVSPAIISVVNRDNKKVTINLDTSTEFRVASDEASIKEVIPGNFLISVGSPLKLSNTTSDFIFLLNPNGSLKIEKTASSSATPSASPKKK